MAIRQKSIAFLLAAVLGISPTVSGSDLIIRPRRSRIDDFPSPSAAIQQPAATAVDSGLEQSIDPAAANRLQERKSGKQPGFADQCDVVQVGWLNPHLRSKDDRKAIQAGFEFAGRECPEVQWGLGKSFSTDRTSSATSVLPRLLEQQEQVDLFPEDTDAPETAASVSGSAKRNTEASSLVNQQVLDDLRSLLGERPQSSDVATPAPEPEVASPSTNADQTTKELAANTGDSKAGFTYLDELQSLVTTEKPWICLQQEYADAHVDEQAGSEPTYYQELQALHSQIRRYHPTILKQAAPTKRFPVALVSRTIATNHTDVSQLFPAMQSLELQKFKEPEGERQTLQQLDAPRNVEEYLTGPFPSCYLTSARWGVSRPNRTTYAFQNNPLYFEDPNLERCGRGSGCLTNFVSIGHFAANTVILPYRLAAEPPCSCVPSLGDCPTCNEYGSDAYLPPWSWKGAIAEAGAVTGLIFIIP
ncbi:MAG: hypothetical protein KDA96_19610 [Planctomycetaceae bacterium]|nr:hypothetical protein [Planctomycetaceae bacterium]